MLCDHSHNNALYKCQHDHRRYRCWRAGVLAVSGGGAVEVFDVTSSSATVSILGLTIEDGRDPIGEDGGGVSNTGTLTLSNTTILDNEAGTGTRGRTGTKGFTTRTPMIGAPGGMGGTGGSGSPGGNGDFAASSSTASLTVAKAVSKTKLTLSAKSIIFGGEHSLKLRVVISSRRGGFPVGVEVITAGKTKLCSITITPHSHGRGSCSPSEHPLAVGKYVLLATL
jgi:hypothetical protein